MKTRTHKLQQFIPKLIEMSRMGPSSIKSLHKEKAENLSHDDTEDDNEKNKLALDVPFTKDNFEKVQEQFCLPPSTPWTILSIHPHFDQHMMNIPDSTIGS